MAENEAVKFLNVFTLFAKYHAIYDNTFIDEANVETLGACIPYILICVHDYHINQQDNASRNSSYCISRCKDPHQNAHVGRSRY